MVDHQIGVCCLQERCQETLFRHDSGIIICMENNKLNTYGLGFYVSNEWLPYLGRYKYIDQRISVIQFNLTASYRHSESRYNNGKSILTIINVHAPTSISSRKNEEVLVSFYCSLEEVHSTYEKQSSFLMISGDFNAKLGFKFPDECFMGSYGTGTRNQNGDSFAAFLSENKLFATNTAFRHKISHRTTWSGYIRGENIYNQIDYVLVRDRDRRLFQLLDARSFSTKFSSDHKLASLKLSFKLVYFKAAMISNSQIKRKWDYHSLVHDKDFRDGYIRSVGVGLGSVNNSEKGRLSSVEGSLVSSIRYQRLIQVLQNVQESMIPKVVKLSKCSGKHQDSLLKGWFLEKQKLTKKLLGRLNRKNRKKIKVLRQSLIRRIRKRVRYLDNLKLSQISQLLESNVGNRGSQSLAQYEATSFSSSRSRK